MTKSSYPKRWDETGKGRIQTLSDGYGVSTLKSNPDKTVTLNKGSAVERTIPMKEFHSLGGFVGLYHEHVHDIRPLTAPFVPYQ